MTRGGFLFFVIPAKAGIQSFFVNGANCIGNNINLMDNMRVLISWHAATESLNRRLIAELVSKDVTIKAIVPKWWNEGSRKTVFEKQQYDNYEILSSPTIFTNHIRAFFYPNVLKIYREIADFKPHIIHIMEEPFSFAAYELIVISKLLKPRPRIILYSAENIDFRQKFLYSYFQCSNLKNADAIAVVPAESVAIWQHRGFRKAIYTIPLGFDATLYEKNAEVKMPYLIRKAKDAFKIGYAGRITPEKGIETVIRALSILKDRGKNCVFFIVGGGDHKNTLQNLISESGINDLVHFLDAISQNEMPAFYNSLDVFVLPSLTTDRWKEQFGRVLIESMASKTPVIGSSSGEIPRVIGNSGLVFKENDALQLADSIQKLIDNDELRAELSKAGYKKVYENYTWSKVAESYIKAYKELLPI
ncbi:glycosyltransferase family 4 protein [Candidatus Magnetomonas plexicatena]|uniref:glycosyltransferase family 4 protein n=1 Tax=Candidatus Magnetomonas plexicatena TaxID=2552947 RepID=UPI00110178B4|nr:glycosyltransferase family 4 protein [Nitrospirales bacterium LBB_01]